MFSGLVIAAASLVSPMVIETDQVDDVIAHVDQKSWFVVDLDNTLFQAKRALGHVDWLQAEVKKNVDRGLSKEEAFHSIYPIWKKTQGEVEVQPVDQKLIEAIKRFQEREIVVMGLTHRQLFIVPETLRQIESLGIDLLVSAPSKEELTFEANQPARYTQGVLFVDDFNTKDEVFRLFMERIGVKPEKVVFIDDKRKNVEELAQAMEEEGIEYVGVHYTAVANGEPIYSPAKVCEQQIPSYLYKIVSKEAWSRTLFTGQLELSEMDEAFVHLATEEQLSHVEIKFWSDEAHMILKIDLNRVTGELIYETNPGGSNKYFHLYEGNIPLEAILEVRC